jgi:hypothetical protein
MQTKGTTRLPIFPDGGVLSQSSVTRARNISQNTVKLEVGGLLAVLGRESDGGELGSIVVCNEKVRGRKSLELMNKHVSALVIGVVGNEHTCSSSGIARVGFEIGLHLLLGLGTEIQTILLGVRSENLAHAGLLTLVDHLEQLRRLASRSSAHVKDGHTRAEVHQHGGDHTDNLLSANISNARLGDQELLECGEGRELANDVLGGSHPPSQVVGVPGHGLRRLDGSAILVLDLDDLGDVSGLEKALDSEGVAGRKS